jgi:hypothetical protein
MSSWFGGGSKKEADSPEIGFSDDSHQSFGGDGGFSGSSSSMADFQQFSVALQQQIMVQTVITELTHKAFIKCCSTSSSRDQQLTGKEVACIHASTNKWLDSNEYMVGRLAKKQQQAAGSSNSHFG